MKNYLKEFEEHLNTITRDVLDEVGPGYETTSLEKKLSNYGRILMDQAVTTKDDALSNVMSKVGDALTRFGTNFGSKTLEELVKETKTSPQIIKKLLAFAEKIQSTQQSLGNDHDSGGLDDEGDDEFTSASDDEMAAMADRAMRSKRK